MQDILFDVCRQNASASLAAFRRIFTLANTSRFGLDYLHGSSFATKRLLLTRREMQRPASAKRPAPAPMRHARMVTPKMVARYFPAELHIFSVFLPRRHEYQSLISMRIQKGQPRIHYLTHCIIFAY